MGRSQLRPRMSKSSSTLSCSAGTQTSRGRADRLLPSIGSFLCTPAILATQVTHANICFVVAMGSRNHMMGRLMCYAVPICCHTKRLAVLHHAVSHWRPCYLRNSVFCPRVVQRGSGSQSHREERQKLSRTFHCSFSQGEVGVVSQLNGQCRSETLDPASNESMRRYPELQTGLAREFGAIGAVGFMPLAALGKERNDLGHRAKSS
jgi:hypothetical protein